VADRQFIAPLGSHATPASWQLPAALEVLTKLAYAKYNGAGAAGSYLPLLRLISDSGQVAAEAVATTTIAAGASADVTWLPFRPCPPSANWPNNNQSAAGLAFGPWAYWKLNEANGVTPAADSSGHGRSLTVRVADVVGGRSGIVPTSADTSSFVTWNAASNVAPWVCPGSQLWSPAVGSWEYWINTPGHAGNETDLGCHGTISAATTRLFRHFLNSLGQPQLEWQDAGGVLHQIGWAVGLNNNTTYQIVFVLDGTNASLYVNGALVSAQAQPAAMKTAFTAVPTLGMCLGGASSRYWTGFLEHVGWYDQVLSAANVLTLYTTGTTLP
jgi:hypothetical protein